MKLVDITDVQQQKSEIWMKLGLRPRPHPLPAPEIPKNAFAVFIGKPP